MLKRLMAAALAPPIVLILAACGGSSHPTTTTKTTSTKAKTGTTATTKAVKPKPTLKLEVRSAVTKGLPFGSSVSATPGQLVQFRAAPGDPAPTELTLSFPKGPSGTLTVTASTSHHTASATVSGNGGKPVTLQDLHFSCLLPPAPTFCPPVSESGSGKNFHLVFKAARTTPIIIVATVGPAPTKPVRTPPSNAVVPPYKLTEGVRAVKTGVASSSKTPFTSSATAAPGDTVIFGTRASGKLQGAAETATITLQQGPGKTLTATASVPGGATSSATITSTSPIALVLPRFSCYVPPSPTFCPAMSAKVGAHKYVLKFSVAPFLPPVVISAVVQAG